jgi:hypothetical protein
LTRFGLLVRVTSTLMVQAWDSCGISTNIDGWNISWAVIVFFFIADERTWV